MKLSSCIKQRTTIFLVIIIAACNTTKHATQSSPISSQLTMYGPAWAALWQQQAAEYKALCFQAYNIAKMRIDEYSSQQHDKPLAIVTDIDETVLDNSPYTVHQSLKGLPYSDSTWMQWTAKIACDTVPGALSFLKYVASKNIQVYYITNRLAAEKNATIYNLKKWNFPFADSNHLLPKTTTSSKDKRREDVARTYSVLLFLGDNLGDFSGIYDHQSLEKRSDLVRSNAGMFGEHFIVLPNIMYGEWFGSFINYQYQQSQAQQSETLKKKMKDY